MRPGRRPARARLLGAPLAVLVVAACAKVAPPPGGPEDRDPPTIVKEAVQPAQGAAGIAPDAEVRFVFSERTDRRSVLRALAVFPRVDFRETSWSEDTLRLRPNPAWPVNRNIVLRVGSGARDRRGNRLAAAFVLRFTTKAVADTGRIAGRLWPGREKTSTAQLLAFAVPPDSLEAEPSSLAEVDEKGEFTLEGLDTGRVWRVAAIIDADGDARTGGRGELRVVSPADVRFPADSSVARADDFLVGTLDSLATIRGDVRADSLAVVVVEAVDAAGARTASEPLTGGGAFTIRPPTGQRVRLAAFLDADGDGAAGAGEARAEFAEEIRLDLTAERTGVSFDLRTAPPPDGGSSP